MDSGLEELKQVYLLDQPRVNFYWTEIEKVLAEVPGFYDFYTSEWAFEQIKMGHLHVWAMDDGAIRGIVLSQISIYPKQKVFEIIAVGGVGTLKFFDEMEEIFEKLAISCDCQSFAATVRPGLARKLQSKGAWTVAHRMIRQVRIKKDN